jgi:hypothetical protein
LLFSLVLGVALAAGAATALLISQVRPTYRNPAELRDATGLRVLGGVSMNWTAPQKVRRLRGRIGFSAGVAGLLMSYGGVMALTLMR